MTLNSERNGIELRFPGKPSDTVLDELHGNGFRWSLRQRIWYAKQTPERIAFAERIAGGEGTDVAAEESSTGDGSYSHDEAMPYEKSLSLDASSVAASDTGKRRIYPQTNFECGLRTWSTFCRGR